MAGRRREDVAKQTKQARKDHMWKWIGIEKSVPATISFESALKIP
jgi:hypothetical protein